MEFRVGDRVEGLIGKWEGKPGKVTEVLKNGRVLVQFEGAKYEMSVLPDDLRVMVKAEKFFEAGVFYAPYVPLQDICDGETRRRTQQVLVKQKKMCPSFPYSCTGECGVKDDK